jgi:hypothetical protein
MYAKPHSSQLLRGSNNDPVQMARCDRDPAKPASQARNRQGAAHAPGRWRRAAAAAPRRDRINSGGLGKDRAGYRDVRARGAETDFTGAAQHGYNPDEPRVPKHNTGGGQWTHVAANGSPNDASDGGEFTRQPYADGHHWVPKQLWRKEPFPTETKAVFNKSKSGPLADPSVNFNDAEHRAYNDAVKKLLDGFLERNTITKEQMTPAQAEEFVQEVKGSVDPRIREFVLKIEREALKYFMRYGPEGRGGGGDEE